MVKNRGKLFCVLILSAGLVLLTLYFGKMAGTVVISGMAAPDGAGPVLSARIPSARQEQTVTAWKAGEGRYYLFLPGYAEGKNLKMDRSARLQPVNPGTEAGQRAAGQAAGTEAGQRAAGQAAGTAAGQRAAGQAAGTEAGQRAAGLSVGTAAGKSAAGLRVENGLSFQADGCSLTLLTGSRIPAVFLTLKHDLSYIEADQTQADTGAAAILSPEGDVLYAGELQEIHGRGNTSWEQEKKPYSIRLEDPVSLFGMAASQNYSLVASTDRTFLRNEISNELGGLLGLVTAGRRQVDLYINGVYRGVYEFCEKVSPELAGIYDMERESEELNKTSRPPQQLTTGVYLEDWNHSVTGKWWDLARDPEDITGGYLLEADDSTRYAEEASGFTLASGGYIVSRSPALLSEKQYQYLSGYLQECETAMVESVGAQDYGRLGDYIDIPSFQAKYLIEEVSKNIDCSASSQYFYKDRNGLLTAGPPWDYDWAYGVVRTYEDINFADPAGFSARDVPGAFVWWQLLYFNNAFYRDMTQTYRTVVVPWLEEILAKKLPEREAQLSDSAVMDYARWEDGEAVSAGEAPGPAEYRREFREQVDAVRRFLTERKAFLSREWAAE